MTIWRRATEGEARRSLVQRANDNTLEVVVFGLRTVAMLAALSSLVAVVALIWTADMRWVGTLAVEIIVGGVAAWAGFWEFGNEEWRRGKPE